MLELVLLLLGAALSAIPLGTYLAMVFSEGFPKKGRFLRGIEHLLYRLAGIDPAAEMDGKTYILAFVAFHLVGIAALVLLQEVQQWLPLNPQGFGPVRWDIALNTAVSFVTNTNWQAYAGEQTLSYLTQMLGLTVQNFVSAAAGLAAMAALARGFVRRESPTIGNFWVDLVRATVYVFLPLSLVLALLLVSQGVVQTLSPYPEAVTLEGKRQVIAVGPVASQVAIKLLGTNGGGFFNANSAHPLENPTPLSNFLEMLAILLIPAAAPFAFGRLVGDRKQGWALFAAMAVLFAVGLGLALWSELQAPKLLSSLGISGGNLEGKEVRFGVVPSVLFGQITTAVACGAVNSAHESFLPLTYLVFIFNMAIGEPIFGGVGAGIVTMVFYALLTMFLAGLMIGRTPEYLGKKLEPYEMVMTVIGVVVPALTLLLLAVLAVQTEAGRAGIASGAHGLSQVFYAFASTTGNNGSAMGALKSDLPFYTLTTALAMLVGRFATILPAIAIGAALARKRAVAASVTTFPTASVLFVGLLVAVVLIVGALTFFPAFVLGPVLEHLTLFTKGF